MHLVGGVYVQSTLVYDSCPKDEEESWTGKRDGVNRAILIIRPLSLAIVGCAAAISE